MASQELLSRLKQAGYGPSALARALGIRSQAVSQWDRVPLDKLAKVSALTGIPTTELRPDVAEAMKGAA